MTRPSAVPPPVTAVLDASSRWLPARLGEVEARLRAASAGHGENLTADATATLAAGGKRLRPLLVLLCAGPEGAEAAVPAATAIELVHMATLVHDDVLDDAPCAGAGRRRRDLGPRAGDGGRRPALLARLRASCRGRRRACGRAAQRGLGGARPRRAGAAPGRLRRRGHRSALPRSLPAEDGEAVRVRLPAWPATHSSREQSRWRNLVLGLASPSSSSTTSSTWRARPSAPARRAAPTCSTAPSPCP